MQIENQGLGVGKSFVDKMSKNKMKFPSFIHLLPFPPRGTGDFPQKLTQLQDNGPKKEGKACQEQNIQESAQKSASSKANSPKYVYDFGKKTDGDATQRSLLGARARTLPKWLRSDFPSHRVLPSLPKFAPISTQTSSPTLRFWRSK